MQTLLKMNLFELYTMCYSVLSLWTDRGIFLAKPVHNGPDDCTLFSARVVCFVFCITFVTSQMFNVEGVTQMVPPGDKPRALSTIATPTTTTTSIYIYKIPIYSDLRE